MDKNSKIFVAGHTGLVGSAIVRALETAGYKNLLLRTHTELDLLNQSAVYAFFDRERPAYVFDAAARVGGIMANKTHPAEFMRENLGIELNVIDAAYRSGVNKLLFLGSSCIYPKFAQQPITEDQLLTGDVEETNRAYAIAKIAGIELCQSYHQQYGANFISLMPTNIYGPNDRFDLETAHVVPALLRKFHEAKETDAPAVSMWGTGSAYREFLHVDDLAAACLYLMYNYNSPDIINVGTGEDISIRDLADMVRTTVGYTGDISWDTSKPDGMQRKRLDVSKLHALGWRHRIDLAAGLQDTYQWYCKNRE